MGEVLTCPQRVDSSYDLRLPRMGSVDAVGLEERAAALAARDVEGATRLQALTIAVGLLELPALDETETPGSVQEICRRAVRPEPADRSVPPVAAICVTPRLVPLCRDCLRDADVSVASLVMPAEALRTVEAGADEIEVKFDASVFLTGGYAPVVDQIARVKDATGEADLTVVVEPGGLGTYDELRRAALLAILAGADFIELLPASFPTALCTLETIRDVCDHTGHAVGLKAVGDHPTADHAVGYLMLAHDTLGLGWMTRDRYRLGGPRLLDTLLKEIRSERIDARRHAALG